MLTQDALKGHEGFYDGTKRPLGTYRACRRPIAMKAIRLFSSDGAFPFLFHLNHTIKECRSKVIHHVPNHLQADPTFYKALPRHHIPPQRSRPLPPTTDHIPIIGSPHTKALTWRPVWPALQGTRCEEIRRTASDSRWRAELAGKRGVQQKTDTFPRESVWSIASRRSYVLRSSQTPCCRYHSFGLDSPERIRGQYFRGLE
jgi:hypothetical protein